MHYPGSRITSLDPRFDRCILRDAGVKRLFTGALWSEGPVWFDDGRYLLWSDIPNNRILRWDEATGVVSVFREPSNNANGNTRDRQGRLITCEHLTRRVTRTEHDGAVTVICDRYDGKRLNSPNDVVVKSDGSIWFTDPRFGISSNYEGKIATPELPMNVYRVDAAGALSIVAEDLAAPNGLCFSSDERQLYVVESRSKPKRILAYDVVGDGNRLAGGKVLIDAGADGSPDGLRCDVDGNLWCGWGGAPQLDGVRIFGAEGEPIGHIALPERCANLCFGGRSHNRLFMAASHSLYSLDVNTQGVGS